MRTGRIVGLAAVPLWAALACGPAMPLAPVAEPPPYEPEGQTQCKVTESLTKPLIVEWPSADRLALEAQAKRGVVAVRYTGCEMEVLRRCSVPVAYRYVATTRQDDRLTIRNEDELYARVPVYAAKLEGALRRAGELTVTMAMVGSFEAERTGVRLDELTGDCRGATHLLTALTAGAFELLAGAEAAGSIEAGVAGVAGGAKSGSKREVLNRAGEPERCEATGAEDRSPPFGCGAILRVEVSPLVAGGTGDPAKGAMARLTLTGPAVEFPEWVLKNTGVFGTKGRWLIHGVGAAKQRTAAHDEARDEVGRVVQVMVRELLKDYAEASTAGDTATGQAMIEQSYAAIMKELTKVSPEMPEHWVHADGTVYALARFELTLLLEVIDEASSVDQPIRDYLKQSADGFFADLQALQ